MSGGGGCVGCSALSRLGNFNLVILSGVLYVSMVLVSMVI